MIRGIVFDFDGVIVESADIKTLAFRRLFEERFPEHADELVAHHLANEGISRFEKFRHAYEEVLGEPYDATVAQDLSARFTDLAVEAIVAAPFVTGALEFLQANDGAARPLFVASGTPEPELHRIVEARGIASHFAEVHGTPDTKAAIIEGVLAGTGLARDEVVMVGDAESDRIAARETGVAFVARRAPGSGKDFAGCDHVIEDLTALEAAIDAISAAEPVGSVADEEE